MLPYKLLYFLFSVKIALFTCCGPEKRRSDFEVIGGAYKIRQIATLPGEVNESSGLAVAQPGKSYWTHNDGGSKPALYEVDARGKLLRTLDLPGLRNRDWEDLARDAAGNLYIGDFGNNNNTRRNLKIYRLHPDRPGQSTALRSATPTRRPFRPGNANGTSTAKPFSGTPTAYTLFSKNRGRKNVKMYVLPARPGDHVAQVRGEVFIKSMVTAADVNPAHNLFAGAYLRQGAPVPAHRQRASCSKTPTCASRCTATRPKPLPSSTTPTSSSPTSRARCFWSSGRGSRPRAGGEGQFAPGMMNYIR
jgi:hypothetical protein